MALTTQAIHDKKFSSAFKGYNDTEVDLFLDEIIIEFDRMSSDNEMLQKRFNEMETRLNEYQSMDTALREALVSAHKTANELISNAQNKADDLMTEASEAAEGKRRSAQLEWEEKTSAAQERVKQLDEEYEAKTVSLKEEYDRKTRALEAEVARLEAIIERRKAEIRSALSEQVAAVKDRLLSIDRELSEGAAVLKDIFEAQIDVLSEGLSQVDAPDPVQASANTEAEMFGEIVVGDGIARAVASAGNEPEVEPEFGSIVLDTKGVSAAEESEVPSQLFDEIVIDPRSPVEPGDMPVAEPVFGEIVIDLGGNEAPEETEGASMAAIELAKKYSPYSPADIPGDASEELPKLNFESEK